MSINSSEESVLTAGAVGVVATGTVATGAGVLGLSGSETPVETTGESVLGNGDLGSIATGAVDTTTGVLGSNKLSAVLIAAGIATLVVMGSVIYKRIKKKRALLG